MNRFVDKAGGWQWLYILFKTGSTSMTILLQHFTSHLYDKIDADHFNGSVKKNDEDKDCVKIDEQAGAVSKRCGPAKKKTENVSLADHPYRMGAMCNGFRLDELLDNDYDRENDESLQKINLVLNPEPRGPKKFLGEQIGNIAHGQFQNAETGGYAIHVAIHGGNAA